MCFLYSVYTSTQYVNIININQKRMCTHSLQGPEMGVLWIVCRWQGAVLVDFKKKIRCLFNVKLHSYRKYKILENSSQWTWLKEFMNATVLFLKSNESRIIYKQEKHSWFNTRHVLGSAHLVSLWEFRQMQSSWRHCTAEGVHSAKFERY
jgi:hypothetical protein